MEFEAFDKALAALGIGLAKFRRDFTYVRTYGSKGGMPMPVSCDHEGWAAAADAYSALPPKGNVVAQRFAYEYWLEREGRGE